MKPDEVRRLVEKYTKAELEAAASKFETERENVLEVQGDDDGEKMSHLLVAVFVRERVDGGMKIPEALREYSQRVRGFVKPKK